jgi:hypothetical protein
MGYAVRPYLLHDIRAKLLNSELADMAKELTDESVVEARIGEVKDILYDVVAESILEIMQKGS